MSTPVDDDQIEIIQEFATESRDMIEQLEKVFKLWRMKAVVQRRHRIEQHQRDAKYTETGNDPRVA